MIVGNSKQIQTAEHEFEKRLKQICKKVQKFEKVDVCDVILSAKTKGTLMEIEENSRCLVKLPGEMDGDLSFLNERDQRGDTPVDERGDNGECMSTVIF